MDIFFRVMDKGYYEKIKNFGTPCHIKWGERDIMKIEELKNEIELLKQKELLAVIFGERDEVKKYREARRSDENLLKILETNERIKELHRDLDKLEKAINARSRIIKR